MPDRITLKDVADKAGVSIMTVSRALRRHKGISDATRDRIRQLAEEMGYRPDPKVSELMSRLRYRRPSDRTETLAMIWPHWQTQISTAVGIQTRAAELGFQVEDFRITSSNPARRIDRVLWNRGIRGIIVGVVPHPHSELDFRWDRYAAVALDYTLENPYIHRVATNQYQTMTTVLDKLRALGYRRIGLAMERQMDDRVNYLWRGGYLAYHSVHPELEQLPFHLPDEFASAPLLEWIKKHRPDCVLSAGRENRVFELMHTAGVKIPEEIGYASFDISPDNPFFSGMNQRRVAKGIAAVDMLVGFLHGDGVGLSQFPRILQIPSVWQTGETTCPPKQTTDRT